MKGIVTAIEFGSSKIACLTGIKRSFGRFELLFIANCPYAGFRKKNWLQNDAIGYAVSEVIRKTQGELGTKINSVYMGVPGEFIKVIQSSAIQDIAPKPGRVTENDLQELKKKASIHEKPDNAGVHKSYAGFYIADDKLPVRDPLGIRAEKLSCEYISIYIDDIFTQDMQGICNTIGIKINGLTCIPQAMAKLVMQEQDADFEIIADVGYYVTDVSIAYGAKLVYHKSLQIGGYHLANDIALCLDIPLEEAEYLKRKMSIDAANKALSTKDEEMVASRTMVKSAGGSAQDIMMARLDEICLLIGQALRQSHIPLGRDIKLCLTGGGVSMIEGIERYFHQRLDRPVKIVDSGIKKADAACYTAALATLFDSFMLEDKEIN